MFERTRFLSRPAAEAQVGHPAGVVVSVTDPDSPPPALDAEWRDVLQLKFFDADDPIAAEVEREGLIVPQLSHARQIVEFLDQWHALHEGPREIVTHCEAGVSRSAAVARFAALRFGLDFPWDYHLYNRRVMRLLEEAASGRAA